MRTIRLDDRHLDQRDRRREPRYPAVDNASEVGWCSAEGMHVTAAQLMDISNDGLLILADAEPAGPAPVVFRLVDPEPTEWVEVRVIESCPTRFGPYQLRLVFCSPPPREFLKKASARLEDDE